METPSNTQALQVVVGMSLAPATRGSAPAPLALAPPPSRAAGPTTDPHDEALPRIPPQENCPQPYWQPFNG
ncbi:UNVERIFIED_CONTAM: hypothetical protein Sradi_4853400 [Sesamum radiatum]|uniref:Uncharacterized protein n=1 Tax=Sesamum radiatum TaxID=300843 RepID=A0AAW2N0H4_SESRA